MGHIYKEVLLNWVRTKKVKMLIDTGSTFVVLPPDLADEIGFPRRRRPWFKVRLANGDEVLADTGSINIELEGRRAPATVVFLEGAEPLLGVEALEALGLKVNPETGELEPTRSYTVRA